MSVPLHQPIRLSFATYSDAAQQTAADPTTVTLTVLKPDGTTETFTWASSQVVHDSPGDFHYDYTPDTAGHYQYEWVAAGAVATAQPGVFDVDDVYGDTWISLADARKTLNSTSSVNDDELRTYIAAATDVIETYIGTVGPTVVTDSFATFPQAPWPPSYGTWPRYTYDGHRVVDLRTKPVQSVQSVVVSSMDGTNPDTLTSSAYRVDLALGTVMVIDSSPFGPLVTITYTAGRTTVPAPVRLAALVLIQHLWAGQRGGAGTDLPPGYDASSAPGTFGAAYGPSFALPNRVKELLEPYRNAPVVA